jgi:predicted ATP-dependent Lon-type protease
VIHSRSTSALCWSRDFSAGAFDSGKSGSYLGVAVLIALCSALLGRSLKGGLAIVGGLNLGGSVELVHNPIEAMELAMAKGLRWRCSLFPLGARSSIFRMMWRRAFNPSSTSMLPML